MTRPSLQVEGEELDCNRILFNEIYRSNQEAHCSFCLNKYGLWYWLDLGKDCERLSECQPDALKPKLKGFLLCLFVKLMSPDKVAVCDAAIIIKE